MLFLSRPHPRMQRSSLHSPICLSRSCTLKHLRWLFLRESQNTKIQHGLCLNFPETMPKHARKHGSLGKAEKPLTPCNTTNWSSPDRTVHQKCLTQAFVSMRRGAGTAQCLLGLPRENHGLSLHLGLWPTWISQRLREFASLP